MAPREFPFPMSPSPTRRERRFGWRARNIQQPQPFLYDALDDRRNEVIDRYETEVNGLIRRHGLD